MLGDRDVIELDIAEELLGSHLHVGRLCHLCRRQALIKPDSAAGHRLPVELLEQLILKETLIS